MRFRRQRTRPALTIPLEDSSQNIIPCSFVVRWNSPFSILNHTHNRNTSGEDTQVGHYVPKCITSVSQSDILCGDRVENFSPDCWLQNHLDQFGHNIQSPNTIMEEQEPDCDDDSPIGSTASTEVNSVTSFEIDDSFEDETVNRLYYALSNMLDIPSYTQVVEPPPYGFQDLPPTYEEAVAGDRPLTSRRSSTSNGSSEVDFIWY